MIIVTAEQAHGIINAAMRSATMQRIREAHADIDEAIGRGCSFSVLHSANRKGGDTVMLWRGLNRKWWPIAKLAPARARGYLAIEGVEGAETV